MSLRARLLLTLVALAAVGLVAANVATYAALRSFLVGQVDNSLVAAQSTLTDKLLHTGHLDVRDFRSLATAEPGVFIQIRDSSNGILWSGSFRRADETSSTPKLPQLISHAPKPAPGVAHRFTTPAAEPGGPSYRVRASSLPVANATLVVALPLDGVAATLHRLLLIEGAVSAAVLVLLGGLAFWLVRLGLRPLTAIAGTAEAIAGGDLTQRVERAEQRTEVGRLGLALNAMLARIEQAFAERAASEDRLRRSEERLRRFVADASHELRTPLSAVKAYAELFHRGADQRPNDLARSMAGIEREASRMGVLVDDLLLLARLDEGRPLTREPVRIDDVAREAVEAARAVDPERPLDLEAQPALVLGDRDRLRQVLDNLLANVRAHTPPGTAARVRIHRADGDAAVEVEDSGPGLEPGQDSVVFERFYRADPGRSRARGGVGLGLSIVAAIAQAHGGTVAAESAPGHGATFRVTLPLLEHAPAQPRG